MHIGLNNVDPVHYQGWNGELFACENDAAVYRTIAERSGFGVIEQLLTTEATSANVLNAIRRAGSQLAKGDIFFITYSGHGGSVPDTNGDEEDGMDETWCLFDRQLIDDELFHEFSQFSEGVRILVFSDSCHSGTIAREVALNMSVPENKEQYRRSRLMPSGPMVKTYSANKELYEQLQKNNTAKASDINAYVLQFGACQDSEEALEAWGNGLFTAKVKSALTRSYQSYNGLFDAIKKDFTRQQHPNIFHYGNERYKFVDQAPFFIDANGLTPGKIFTNDTRKDSIPQNTSQLIVEVHNSAENVSQGYKTRNIKSRDQGGDTLAQGRGAKFFTKDIPDDGSKEWDKAYETYLADNNVSFVEPNIRSPYLQPKMSKGAEANEYLKNWPAPDPSLTEFIWHLDDNHSQLRRAFEEVTKRGNTAKVRIGHIDTGYRPDHPSLPENLMKDLGVSFVKDEFGTNKGIDQLNTGFPAEQDGHGCATLALLAGNKISKDDSYAAYEGWFGAIPFAEVIPIRICDTVFNLFNANDVADGIDYAVNYGCEVITMSMAGYPTKRVAEAVNRAYENGVIVVTAAGNNFEKGIARLSPKAVLYPARFERVIAATGACYNAEPYDLDANNWFRSRMEGGEFMQGNWGPESAMKTAIAAYTPNVAWASLSRNYRFHRSGGGTSSATPQVAATAALWLAYNRDKIESAGIERSWKKVEAARSAIFSSGNKAYPAYRKYYGNGIIRAFDALNAFNFENIKDLKQSPKAKVGLTGFIDFASGWFRSKAGQPAVDTTDVSDHDGLQEMVSLELLQLIHRDPALFPYAEILDLENDETASFFNNEDARKSFAEKVMKSPFASSFLKNLISNYSSKP